MPVRRRQATKVVVLRLRRWPSAPVPEGYAGAQSLAPAAAPMPASHVGGRPGFVDEDEALGIEVELALEPLPSPVQDIGTVLLSRVAGLFYA